MKKKTLCLLLAVCLLISCSITSFAAVTGGGCVYCGGMNLSVCSYHEQSGGVFQLRTYCDDCQACSESTCTKYRVSYVNGTKVQYIGTGAESYTITVPAELKPGQSGTVTLSGTWADNRMVTVTADQTVALTNSINASDKKVLDIAFAGIAETGSNTGSQTFTESVSVENITNALFGTWSGKFYYNVELIDSTNITHYSYNGTVLPAIPEDSNYPYVYLLEIKGLSLEQQLKENGFGEYVGLIDVGYMVQLSECLRPHGNTNVGQDLLLHTQGTVYTYAYFEGMQDWFLGGTTAAEDSPGPWYLGDDVNVIWCNDDIVKSDGTMYLAASTPIPVLN